MVEEAQGAVGGGQDTVGRVVQALASIHTDIAPFSSMMREINAATEEQARTSVQVTSQVEASSQQTAHNASAVNQVTSTVEEVARTASDLSVVAERLSALVHHFRT